MTTPTRDQDADTPHPTTGTGGTAPRGLGLLRHRLESAELRTRLIVAAVCTVPLILFAATPLGDGLGAARAWAELVVTTPVALWAAWPIHREAIRKARERTASPDTLAGLAIAIAYAFSLAATLAGQTGQLYYATAAGMTTLLLAGRVAEAWAAREGLRALQSLVELGRGEVTVLSRGAGGTTREERIGADRLEPGMRFLVHPGERIATDGVVLEGRSAIDTARITGEPVPTQVEAGDRVFAGGVNTAGLLLVRAESVGSGTMLGRITGRVESAQVSTTGLQSLAGRVAAAGVPAVLALAVLTFAGWLATGHDATAALSVAVAVLVAAGPGALGLTTSSALLAGAGRGAQLGVLIKGAQILEPARRVTTVVLDKTGTVTSGHMRLIDIATVGRLTSTAALQAAAAVESASAHPVAVAIVAAARERGLSVPATTGSRALSGAGMCAHIKDTEVTVGPPDLFERVPDQIAGPDPAGMTVLVGWGGTARAALTVADGVRPDSRTGMVALHDLGLRNYLLTGDSPATAARVAQEIGIETGRVIPGVPPAEQAGAVHRLRREGACVAMVGDSGTDASALAAADLSVVFSSLGPGLPTALESADIVLLRPRIAAVADAIHLSRRILRVCHENVAWAVAYNIVAIPLAVFGWLDPVVAAGAMAASSVLVACNSLRLRSVGTAAHEDPWDGAAVAALQGDRSSRSVEGDGQQPGGAVRRNEREGDDAGGLVRR